jgi:hypothetical protein
VEKGIVCTKIIAKDYQLTNSAFYLPVFRNTSIFHAKRAAATQKKNMAYLGH